MKIRQGFVSNSSSSSFIVLLPKNFDPIKYADNIPDSEIDALDYEIDRDRVKIALKMLVTDSSIWGDDYIDMSICAELLDEYIISTIDGGPDDGAISLVSDNQRTKIKNILNQELRYDKLKKIKENEN
jgi:hypothetical protein